MSLIDFEKYDRIWCFGCSFTNYIWDCWPELLHKKYRNVKNYGKQGAGNGFIFHKIMEIHSQNKISANDLVMVSWTNFFREDRKLRLDTELKWYAPGNLMNQKIYPKDYIKKWCDPKYFLERDLMKILAINSIFKDQIINFSMGGVDLFDQYKNLHFSTSEYGAKIKEILSKFYPSFFEVLWNNDITKVLSTRDDSHPTTDEHKQYLKTVFGVEI
jgi:hypothetical protein